MLHHDDVDELLEFLEVVAVARVERHTSCECAWLQYLEGSYEFSTTPLMLLYGAADQFIPPPTGPEIYAMAQSPKFLVTITNGTHWPPYRDDPDPADETVIAATIDFWNHYLAGRDDTLDALLADAAVEGVTTLEYETR